MLQVSESESEGEDNQVEDSNEGFDIDEFLQWSLTVSLTVFHLEKYCEE